MITDNGRWPDVPLEGDEPLSPADEARALLQELASCEIYLRLHHGRVRWTTTTSRGMSIAQIRSVKRLDQPLRALLAARLDHQA